MSKPERVVSPEEKEAFSKIFTEAGIPYPEEAIKNKENDPEAVRFHEECQANWLKVTRRYVNVGQRIKTPNSAIARFFEFYGNGGEKPEDIQEDEAFGRQLHTPEGMQAFMNRIVKECLEADLSGFIFTDLEDMARRYFEQPEKYEMFMVVSDILKVQAQGGVPYTIEEPLLSALKEREALLQAASGFKTAASIMASDEWALVSAGNLSGEQLSKMVVPITKQVQTLFKQNHTEAGNRMLQLADNVPQLGMALTDRPLMQQLQQQKLLEDNVMLSLGDKPVPRGSAVSQLLRGVRKPEDFTISYRTPEEMQELRRALEELPLTTEELKQSPQWRRLAHRDEAEKMLAYHAPFMPEGVKLPSVRQLTELMADPELSQLHGRAKNEYPKIKERIEQQMTLFPHDPAMPDKLNRVYRNFLRLGNSPQDLEFNLRLQRMSGTPEGQKEMMQMAVAKLLDYPSFIFHKSRREAVECYLNDPQLYELAWAAQDLTEAMNKFPHLKVGDPAEQEFRDKQALITSASAIAREVKTMVRDDWALLTSLDISLEQSFEYSLKREKKRVFLQDPYAVLPQTDDAGHYLDEAFQYFVLNNSSSGIKPLLKVDEEHAYLFSHGTQLSLNGEKLSQNQALEKLFEGTDIEDFSVSANPKKEMEIEEQLDGWKLGQDSYLSQTKDSLEGESRRKKATAGRALQRDMEALYQDLDSVNHGMFISTEAFDKVIGDVEKMKDSLLSPDQAKELLEKLVTDGEDYLKKKQEKLSGLERKDWKQRDSERFEQVQKAVFDAQSRIAAIDAEHERGRQIRENFSREFTIADDRLKSAPQTREDELVRALENRALSENVRKELETELMVLRESRRLSAKFAANQEKFEENDVGNPLPMLSPKELKARLNDPRIIALHERAKKLNRIAANFTDEYNSNYTIGHGHADLNRVMSYFMDHSGTPEAEEHNRLMGAALSTPEGYKAAAARLIHRILTDPALKKALTATTWEEALDAYEANPLLCEAAFNIGNFQGLTNDFEEPLKTSFQNLISTVEGARECQTVVRYLASDVFLAFPEVGPQTTADEKNRLYETVQALAPEDANAAQEAYSLDFANYDNRRLLKKLLDQKDVSLLNVRLSDPSGRAKTDKEGRISIQEGLTQTTKKNNKSIKVTGLPKAERETLQKQLEAMDVAEPLNLGRRILEGRYPEDKLAVTGPAYNERIRELIKTIRDPLAKNPGAQLPMTEEIVQYLESMKAPQEEAVSPEKAEKNFTLISERLKADYRRIEMPSRDLNRNMTPEEDRQRKALENFRSAVANADKLQSQVFIRKAQILKAYQEQPFDNGVERFMQEHLTPEKAERRPAQLSERLETFRIVSKDYAGMEFEKLPKTVQEAVSDGLAAVMMLNHLELSEQKAQPDVITQVLSGEWQKQAIEEISRALPESPNFRAFCGQLLRKPAELAGRLENGMAEGLDSGFQESLREANAAIEVKKQKKKEQAELLKKNEAPVKKEKSKAKNVGV